MKVLITGITGQVGSLLADYLLGNTECEIVGMMRWQEPLDNIYHLTDYINADRRVRVQYADLGDFRSIYDLVATELPDIIFHLAAQSFPKTSFDIPLETLSTNILGTATLLESIQLVRQAAGYDPVVHICSSSEVYGRVPTGTIITESTQLHGASPYSISKIGADYLGRFYAEAYGIKTFITRMGTHSGPRRSDVFFESTLAKQIALIEAGLQEPSIKLGCLDSIRTFQDARDAVRAYYLLAEAMLQGHILPGDVFNIAGTEAFKLTEVVEIFMGLSTKDGIVIEEDKARLRPIDANYQMFDNAKIMATINWRPEISAKEMFSALLEHWREQVRLGRIPINR